MTQMSLENSNRPWWKELTRYHWWILIIATMGWMFDTMDQRLFVLARKPAMQQLIKPQADAARAEAAAKARSEGKTPVEVRVAGEAAVKATGEFYGGLTTALLLIGWATGGIFFGMMGDKWGRAKTMLLTILVYSLFTGLSALSTSWWDFAAYRFLTGTGVGGEFAAGVALVAEVMPNRARPHALGLLQAMASVGNIIGSVISFFILPLTITLACGWVLPGWRLVFLVGILPALIVVFALRRLKEPESWVKLKRASLESSASAPKLGSYREMFGDKRWRYNTLIGVLLAVSGVIGLWGIGFFTPELISGNVIKDITDQSGNVLKEITDQHKTRISSIAMGLQDGGAIFGIMAFSWLAVRMGRRLAFALAFAMALVMTVMVFGFMRTESQIYWMIPMLGFANLAIFGGYAIYFPELYPTRLRSTGTGFCYNVARYISAAGPFALGSLAHLYSRNAAIGVNGFRYAACTVAGIYLLGLITLLFAPETKGKPLPG
jgi:MFS family permease